MPYSQRGRHAGDGRRGAAGPAEEAVADEHGAVVLEAPDGTLAEHRAVGPRHALRVDCFDPLGVGKLECGGPASRRFLVPLAGSAASFFRLDTVGGGGGRWVGWGGGRLPENLGVVLGEPLLETLDFGVEVLDEALLPTKLIEQRLGRERPASKSVLASCAFIGRRYADSMPANGRVPAAARRSPRSRASRAGSETAGCPCPRSSHERADVRWPARGQAQHGPLAFEDAVAVPPTTAVGQTGSEDSIHPALEDRRKAKPPQRKLKE